MAIYVALHDRVYVGALDLTAYTRSINFGPIQAEPKEITTFNDGGFPVMVPGLISGQVDVGLMADYAAGAPDEYFWATNALGTQFPVSVAPNPAATDAAGDPAWFTRGITTQTTALGGSVGNVAEESLQIVTDTAVIRGVVGHPKAARTTTGNGTTIAYTGPTSTQRLYAAFHVTAYSGITNVIFKVQSDDNGGMSSPTDRITSSTFTGIGSQFTSVAGYGATENQHRVTWTITGVGSVTFAAFFGVL